MLKETLMFENVIQLFKSTSRFGVIFETYEVAQEVLKLLDENTGIKWKVNAKPLIYSWYFRESPKTTILFYHTYLRYGTLDYYKESKTAQQDFPVIYFLSSSGELKKLFNPPKCLRRL